ncbi:MAG: FtsW/RodA/SpoVE family cell cycle protein [Candidatus Babeliales bacterium]
MKQIVHPTTHLYRWLAIMYILIAWGILFIYSASAVFALEKMHCPYYFVKKQLLGLAIGSIGMVIIMLIPTQLIYRLAYLAIAIALFFTILTICTGHAQLIHGSSRWLAIGPFSFQPSEFLKYATIIGCARFLTSY